MLFVDIFQLLERERNVMEHQQCVRLKGAVFFYWLLLFVIWWFVWSASESRQDDVPPCDGQAQAAGEICWIVQHSKKHFERPSRPFFRIWLLTHPAQKKISSKGPAWVPDKDVSECANCGFEFSLFIRKHHCRCSNGNASQTPRNSPHEQQIVSVTHDIISISIWKTPFTFTL